MDPKGTCRVTERERFEDPNCPIHGIAEQRRRHEQARKAQRPKRPYRYGHLALAAVVLAGCASTPAGKYPAELWQRCVAEHRAEMEVFGNRAAVNEACARWADAQVKPSHR